MIFGFTGTQQGMTDAQRKALQMLLRDQATGNDEFHHGDCVGADAQAHDLAEEFQFFIVSHPPIKTNKRAWKNASIVCEPKEYLQRNRDVVDECDVLVATPFEFIEVLRSGTWSTIRYALKRRKPYYVIKPDGTVTYREPRT